MIKIVGDYLGTEPYLNNADVWWDRYVDEDQIDSRTYHFDGNDPLLLKVFFYLTDVGEKDGPFTYISKTHKFVNKFGLIYKHSISGISDSNISSNTLLNVKKFVGKPGDVIFADTNGLHIKMQWEDNVTKMISIFNNLNSLINKYINAGTNIPEHFTKVQKKNMEYLVKLNTISTFHIAQLCTLKMLEAKNRKKIGGSIINMSSQMGHVGGPIRSVYNMTKSGLEGLTKGMAIDLAKNNIRVNTVCPTFVVTPMTKKFLKNKKFKNNMLKNIPLGRFADSSDVATTVAFLASDASSMITGTSILVDGGWTAI